MLKQLWQRLVQFVRRLLHLDAPPPPARLHPQTYQQLFEQLLAGVAGGLLEILQARSPRWALALIRRGLKPNYEPLRSFIYDHLLTEPYWIIHIGWVARQQNPTNH